MWVGSHLHAHQTIALNPALAWRFGELDIEMLRNAEDVGGSFGVFTFLSKNLGSKCAIDSKD